MINLILQDFIYRVDNTVRFNGTRTIQQKETVSQHSYWVIFYCNLIFKGIFQRQIMLTHSDDFHTDVEERKNLMIRFNLGLAFLLKQAIYHDFEENITGDVLYHTKYDTEFGDEIKKYLNLIKLRHVEKMEPTMLQHDYQSVLKTDLFPEIDEFDLTIDEKKICMNVLKMSDWLSCLRFAFTEIELGNKLFDDVMTKAIHGVESCLTQIELLIYHINQDFTQSVRSELIELKTKLNIL